MSSLIISNKYTWIMSHGIEPLDIWKYAYLWYKQFQMQMKFLLVFQMLLSKCAGGYITPFIYARRKMHAFLRQFAGNRWINHGMCNRNGNRNWNHVTKSIGRTFVSSKKTKFMVIGHFEMSVIHQLKNNQRKW